MFWWYALAFVAGMVVAAVPTALLMRARAAAKGAEVRARLDERDRQLRDQSRLLDPVNGKLKETLQQLLGSDFETLANRVIDEKTRAFAERSDSSLKLILKPFSDQLARFQKQHEEQSHRGSREQQQLLDRIIQTQEMNRKLSEQAEQLTRALRGDSKVQGDWGEVSLQRILEQSGLQEGREYETQAHIPPVGEEKALRADVVLHLPRKREVIIDAKVSLGAYTSLYGAEQAKEYQEHLALHAKSVRNHIKELADKRYQDRWQRYRPETVTEKRILMFVPIEGAVEIASRHDPGLQQYAQRNNVVLVNPITMIAFLQVLESMWRIDQQNSNVEKMFIEAGKVYDKCANFVESMDKIGTHLAKTDSEYRKAISQLRDGRGNLLKSAQRLKELGASTTKQIEESGGSDSLL